MNERDTTINNNIGLVHSLANKFKSRGIEYDDLFQAGCIGLIKSVDGFDKSRGLCFSTYAVPVILGEIKRLFRDGGSVKIGRSLKELSLKATRTREILSHKLGRDPTISELAAQLNTDVEHIALALTAALPPISLTISEEDGGGQGDIPASSENDEIITDKIALKEVLNDLPPNDRTLIFLRYFNSKTQMQTAQKLGMTQVQVSRREKFLLNKIKNKLSV